MPISDALLGKRQPKWRIGASTDVGVKRRGRPNEDSIGVFQSRLGSRPPLLVVADGMGGYKGGALASRTVVDSFEQTYRNAPTGQSVDELLRGLVRVAHAEISQIANQDESLGKMGSTVVAAILGSDRVGIVNVGDSRAYVLRNGALQLLSRDHSRVGEMLEAGEISAEEARTHPKRSLLTMSLSPKRTEVYPFVCEEAVTAGETLLLCSDGLWGPVSSQEIVTVLGDLDPQPAAEKLVELANISQGPDNISVIVARLGRRTRAGTDDDTGS